MGYLIVKNIRIMILMNKNALLREIKGLALQVSSLLAKISD